MNKFFLNKQIIYGFFKRLLPVITYFYQRMIVIMKRQFLTKIVIQSFIIAVFILSGFISLHGQDSYFTDYYLQDSLDPDVSIENNVFEFSLNLGNAAKPPKGYDVSLVLSWWFGSYSGANVKIKYVSDGKYKLFHSENNDINGLGSLRTYLSLSLRFPSLDEYCHPDGKIHFRVVGTKGRVNLSYVGLLIQPLEFVIEGPSSVPTNTTALYQCKAKYYPLNDSSKWRDVTTGVLWSTDSEKHLFTNNEGEFLAGSAINSEPVALTVKSSETNVSAIKNISVFPTWFDLQVNSSGATGVTITSSTGHGGTTNPSYYLIPSLASGTSVSLTAPATVEGTTFSHWSGAVNDNNRTINFNMNSDKEVTANYIPLVLELSVKSFGATQVQIYSADVAYRGTTEYKITSILYDTSVNLQAPMTVGDKVFSNWSGAVNDFNPNINVRIKKNEVITANYSTQISVPHFLEQGWNLISIDLNLTENAQQLLRSKKAMTLSSAGNAYVFSDNLMPTQACWIFSQTAETITLTGISPENFDFAATLKKGWNFVGPLTDSLLSGDNAIAWEWNGKNFSPTKNLRSCIGYYLYWPGNHAGVIPLHGDYLIIDLSRGPKATSYPVSYLTASPTGYWSDEYKTTKLVLRKISAGTFTMGSPENELGRDAMTETQHQVTLTKDFYVGVFEVTQKQWERVMGAWPSYFYNASYRDARPVEKVSYNDIRGSDAGAGWPANRSVDADSFLGRMRTRTGLDFDLPTEAQWEYACRAGTTTALNSGKDLTSTLSCPNVSEVGRYWYNGGSGYSSGGDTSGGTAKVGSYLPNQWGLYDMHGNVWEWCLDWYQSELGSSAQTDPRGAAGGSYRVYRGGGWYYTFANDCRSADRLRYWPSSRDFNLGFRLVRTVP